MESLYEVTIAMGYSAYSRQSPTTTFTFSEPAVKTCTVNLQPSIGLVVGFPYTFSRPYLVRSPLMR